ncbi:hypothetical protein SDC9_204932 [bioreactor metagenome]|uniref:Uncharacterized protein n=1 Tax=bioreactor metagenome TaxID=1076179 RepID=A0A645J0M8_9ZZZZ
MEQDGNYVDNHKAYVQSWIQAIKEKPDTLIKAIREAEKTANYLEYNADLMNEKEYQETLNNSIEVDNKNIQSVGKDLSGRKSLADIKNKIDEHKQGNTYSKANIKKEYREQR